MMPLIAMPLATNTLSTTNLKGPRILPFCAFPGGPSPEEDWETDEPFGDFCEPDIFVPDEEAFPEPGDFWIDDDDWEEAA